MDTINNNLDFYSRFEECEQSLISYDKVHKQYDEFKNKEEQIQAEINEAKVEIPNFADKIGCTGYGCGCLTWFVIASIFSIPFHSEWDGDVSTLGFFVSLIGSTVTMFLLFYLYMFIRKIIWLLCNGDEYREYKRKESVWNEEINQIREQMNELMQKQSDLYNSTIGEIYTLLTLKEISVPISENSITEENFDIVKELFLNIANSLRRLRQSTPINRMENAKELADKKLDLFCKITLKKEANENAYNALMSQGMLDPVQFRNLAVTGFTLEKQNLRIVDCVNLLNENRIDSILNELEWVKNRDVSGFLGLYTDTDKMSEQYEDMRKLRDAAHEEYEELGMICDELSDTLDQLRTFAFQNIYLGVELLNVIRQGAGGGSLTRETDNINLEDIDLSLYSVTFQGYNTDNVSKAMKNYDNIARTIVKNKDVRQLIYNNKKVATGFAILGVATMAMAAAADHAAKVDRIQADQANIVKDIQIIVDGYSEGRAQLFRVIEVAQSIVKANEGFMFIYNKIKTKVFDNNQMPSIPEIQDLCKAIKSYKEISNSKL